jgi:hypothetical protein
LNEHEVLFFRDQDTAPEVFASFAKRFGKVLDHAIDGTVGITASCTICSECLFDYPAMLPFALSCGMISMLACHSAEKLSGSPTLGVRIFSADELFLICSAGLAYRALAGRAMVDPNMLPTVLQRCIIPFWGSGIAFVSVSVVRRPQWVAALVAFAVVCYVWPLYVAATLYVPIFGYILVSNARVFG